MKGEATQPKPTREDRERERETERGNVIQPAQEKEREATQPTQEMETATQPIQERESEAGMRPPNQPNRERGGENRSVGRERERAVRQGCGHQINRQGRREERRIEEKKREKGREERRREERESRHHPINTRESETEITLPKRERETKPFNHLSLLRLLAGFFPGWFLTPHPFLSPSPSRPILFQRTSL